MPIKPVIYGLSPDAPITTNENGGKQSATPYGFHLLPTSAVFAAAEVAAYGANKYNETFSQRNYTKISTEEHINHAIQHLYAYLAGDTTDDHLGHAIVRAMFAYDTALLKSKEHAQSKLTQEQEQEQYEKELYKYNVTRKRR